MVMIKKCGNFNNLMPKVGDYVICNENIESFNDEYKFVMKFINNSVGQIVSDNVRDLNFSEMEFSEKDIDYRVEYFNIPPEISQFFNIVDDVRGNRLMRRHEILHFSSSKEEMELKLVSMKYNI
jgi:hypothetical protein